MNSTEMIATTVQGSAGVQTSRVDEKCIPQFYLRPVLKKASNLGLVDAWHIDAICALLPTEKVPPVDRLISRCPDQRIRRALQYIEDHLSEALSVEHLSKIACLSAGHFSRQFRTHTGEAVWAFIQRRRCETARALCAEGNISLAEIAYHCGFANQAHMTTSFKKRFGATPSVVRRKCRGVSFKF